MFKSCRAYFYKALIYRGLHSAYSWVRYFKTPKVPIWCQFLANWYLNAYLKTVAQRLNRKENKSKGGIVNNLKFDRLCPKTGKLQQESEKHKIHRHNLAGGNRRQNVRKRSGIGHPIRVSLRLENWVARLGKIGKAVTILTEYPK